MPLTVKNCLNRWCLRTAESGTAVNFINLIRKKHGMDSVGASLKGRPPLLSACIAPHCDHWEAIDDKTGHCLIRRMLKSKKANIPVTTRE